MKKLLKSREKRKTELKILEQEILKQWQKPDDKVLDLMNKINYLLFMDDGLIEEYQAILKQYYNKELCEDVFNTTLSIIYNRVGDFIENMKDLDIDTKVIYFTDDTPHEIIMQLIELLESSDYINEKIGWTFEFDSRYKVNKLSLCVKEV
jgi:hypothetical protein